MANVANLFRAPKKRLPMEEVREARILADFGLEGCAHAQPAGSRQILLVDRETLEAMDLQPGILRENITTDGVNVNSLQIGQRLRVGAAQLEVTGPAQGTLGPPRYAVSCAARRPHSPRRPHRKAILNPRILEEDLEPNLLKVGKAAPRCVVCQVRALHAAPLQLPDLRLDGAAQGGSFRRAVLVLFGFLDGLGRRDDPVHAVLLVHRAKHKGSISRNQR